MASAVNTASRVGCFSCRCYRSCPASAQAVLVAVAVAAALLRVPGGGLVAANPHAKDLYDDLLWKTGYNRIIRPATNRTARLQVRIGLKLSQLIDVVSVCVCVCVCVYVYVMFA